jgi:hypothetical protein
MTLTTWSSSAEDRGGGEREREREREKVAITVPSPTYNMSSWRSQEQRYLIFWIRIILSLYMNYSDPEGLLRSCGNGLLTDTASYTRELEFSWKMLWEPPEPDGTNPGIPSNFFQVHFHITLQCTPKPFRQAYAPKRSIHLSFAPCAKNAPPHPHLVLLDFITWKYEILGARKYLTKLALQKPPAPPVSRTT